MYVYICICIYLCSVAPGLLDYVERGKIGKYYVAR